MSWDAVETVSTRIAQKVYTKIEGQESTLLETREYFDYNPPSKAHWGYKVFHKKIDPESKKKLPDPDNYVWMKMNPEDNAENLNPKYIEKNGFLYVETERKFTVFLDFLKDFVKTKIPDNLDLVNITSSVEVKTLSGKKAIYVLRNMVLPYYNK